MARRSVTATFAGGMNSDEFKPGTARYVENFVSNGIDGLVPIGPIVETSHIATGMYGSSGAWGSATAYMYTAPYMDRSQNRRAYTGWSRGGTVHPKFGFVGLADYSKVGIVSGDWQGETVTNSTARNYALVTQRSTGVKAGELIFSQSSEAAPIGGALYSTSTAQPLQNMMLKFQNMTTRRSTWVNTEDEALFCGQHGVSRYAGGFWSTAQGFATSTANTSAAATTAMTGWARPISAATGALPYTTGEYTDLINLSILDYNDFLGANTLLNNVANGNYLSLMIGPGLKATENADYREIRNFRVVELVSSSVVRIDRKIMMDSSASYLKAVVSPFASLDVNQVSKTARTQPWGANRGSGFYMYDGTTTEYDIPLQPTAIAACYHQGRLFVASNDTVRWSATVDETLQLTCNTSGATSTATSASMSATAINVGIEYKHINLWSENGELPVFGGIGRGIVGLASVGDELLIMKRGAMFRMVGGVSYDGASNSLDLQVVSEEIGPESESSWAKTPDGIVFTCRDSIYLYDGSEIVNISQGTISRAYRENMLWNRSYIGFNNPMKVTYGGGKVFISQQLQSFGMINATLSVAQGTSEYHKHLVLDMSSRSWQFISHKGLSTPAAILQLDYSDSQRSSQLLFLGDIRPYDYYGTVTEWKDSVPIVDVKNVFHSDGMLRDTQIQYGTSTARVARTILGETSHLITHPLSGYGSMSSLRPRSLHLKRTIATTSTQLANRSTLATALPEATSTATRVYLHDSESGFAPLTDQASFSNPLWWAGYQAAETLAAPYADPDRTASMSDPGWQTRNGWAVGTSTGVAASTVDRIMLGNIESAMTAPVIHYRDACWSQSGTTRTYESHIIHALELEFDDVENRTDR